MWRVPLERADESDILLRRRRRREAVDGRNPKDALGRGPVMDDAQLRTIWQQRRADVSATPLAATLGVLMKRHLARRVRQLGELALLWDEVIPDELRRHTALESYQRGVLTVMVDSASHRFQLQTLLSGGLLKALQQRFGGPLDRVRLVPGQFYTLDPETGRPRYEV